MVDRDRGRPRKKPKLKRFGTDQDRAKYLRARDVRDASHKFETKPFQITPTVRVKCYAHDRVVFTIFDKLPPACTVRRQIGPSVGEIIAGSAALVPRRETRRGFYIGNRWRFRPPYNTFTVHARNTVMDAAHIIEHGAEGTPVFQTLTIAGGTRKAYACMAAGSGYIVDRIGRWLRGKVVNGFFVYVWELQSRGAPHLHYIFRLPDGVDPDDFGVAFKDQWRKILDDVSDQSWVDLYARDRGGTWRGDSLYPRTECKPITDSYAKYISKYVSKERTKGGISSPFRPGRWWGISYAVRREVRKRRLDVYFPVRSIEHGVELARNIIAIGGAVVVDSKWLELPPHVVLQSVSIFSEPGVSKPAVLALIEFVASGDVGEYVARLKALAMDWDERKKKGEFAYGLP